LIHDACLPRRRSIEALHMEELFKSLAGTIALGVETIAALIILFGALEAIVLMILRYVPHPGDVVHRKEIWVRFAMWLLLALEFELAADVVRTAITPTWDDVGQLGAIAAIRTVLNYSLEKDIEKYAARARE
jgi:uncharacterized membrane protein